MTSMIPPGCYALLGGSFDPVHLGHLHIAEEILSLTPCARVIFIPNGRHNFKQDTVVLPFDQRYDLLLRATSYQPRFEVWDADRNGSGYTDELLRGIYKAKPGEDFCFVIGSDNLRKLSRWHNYIWLKDNVHFVIIPRPGWDLAPEQVSGLRHTVLQTVPMDISSSGIRELIRVSGSISQLVPEELEKDIYQLYQERIRNEE